jgi:hypothetical protein
MRLPIFILINKRLHIVPCAAFLFVIVAIFGKVSLAQMETATLSGTVMDQSGAVLQDTEVQVTNSDTNITVATTTNRAGVYVVSGLKPGRYRVLVMKQGFKQVSLTDVILTVQDVVSRNFNLQVGATSETISVVASSNEVQMSPAVTTVVDQRLVQELPLNGRSFQTLFQLTPGAVITPTDFIDQGQFSINGERTNSNYFTVDGVSANVGVAAGSQPGQSFGGSLPALTAAGGTNSLVSTEAVQEFAIQTSSYAPEFGRTPGGQVSIVTQSGTDKFHGGAFDYVRNDIFDANDWFANHDALKRAALRQNDFGGVFGGPLVRNKTFFFFSYEGLRLRQPITGQTDVPSLSARQAAPSAIQPFFNAYPQPTGIDEGTGLAPANYSFSNPSTLDAASIRVDHHVRQSLLLFARYSYSPSNVNVRGGGLSLSDVTNTNLSLQTLTLGATMSFGARLSNDVRFNWSRSSAESSNALDTFGGAVPLRSQQVFPASFGEGNSEFVFFPDLSGQNVALVTGKNVANAQRQLNFIDDVARQLGAHYFKAGVDVRRLAPQFNPSVYDQGVFFDSIQSAMAQSSFFTLVQAAVPVQATYFNYSLYLQDNWKPVPRFSATYGLRWDFNPAPTGRGRNGLAPFAVRGIDNLSLLSLAPAGTPLYRATRNNIAPRMGFAYQLRGAAGNESVIRAGAGIFYDLGSGPSGNAFGLFFPFLAVKSLFGIPFPLSAGDASAPPITTDPPFSTIIAFPRTLKQPYSYHWNLAFEQSILGSQSLSLSYVGAAGHQLLRTDQYIGGGLPPTFTEVDLVTNAGYSNYNAFQAQFRRRATNGIDLLASYTLSHSLDNGSSDSEPLIPGRFVNPKTDYGSSDFDIRHTAAVAIDYSVPDRGTSWPAKLFLHGWSVDPIITARSSPVVNVVVSRDIGFGSYNFRPDLLPGSPLYVDDRGIAGGRKLNAAALSVPSAPRQGDLRRNAFRGFPLLQADLSVRRRFRLREKLFLQARVEAFNILNHPNFAPEEGLLGTVDSSGTFFPQSSFGISQSMLGRGLQAGSFGSGFNPLYQIGGPRSLQIALKLEF